MQEPRKFAGPSFDMAFTFPRREGNLPCHPHEDPVLGDDADNDEEDSENGSQDSPSNAAGKDNRDGDSSDNDLWSGKFAKTKEQGMDLQPGKPKNHLKPQTLTPKP